MMDQAEAEKSLLVRRLDAARRDTLAILEGADEALIVHADTGWRVKDVVAHILVWEEEALASLLALKEGRRYTIAEFGSFEAYNQRDFERRYDTPFARLKTELHDTRERMKAALLVLPPERFEGLMLFPWPSSGTLGLMMEIMAAHEREHAEAIRQAVERAGTE
jgi:hypothetical protein